MRKQYLDCIFVKIEVLSKHDHIHRYDGCGDNIVTIQTPRKTYSNVGRVYSDRPTQIYHEPDAKGLYSYTLVLQIDLGCISVATLAQCRKAYLSFNPSGERWGRYRSGDYHTVTLANNGRSKGKVIGFAKSGELAMKLSSGSRDLTAVMLDVGLF